MLYPRELEAVSCNRIQTAGGAAPLLILERSCWWLQDCCRSSERGPSAILTKYCKTVRDCMVETISFVAMQVTEDSVLEIILHLLYSLALSFFKNFYKALSQFGKGYTYNWVLQMAINESLCQSETLTALLMKEEKLESEWMSVESTQCKYVPDSVWGWATVGKCVRSSEGRSTNVKIEPL